MKVENRQELEKLIKLLRKMGVESIKTDGLELNLRDQEPPSKYKARQDSAPSAAGPRRPSTDEEITEQEKILFWSSSGLADSES